MADQIHSYTELEQQIHDDLRTQHPEWIEPTGKCPKCDEHEERLKRLLGALGQTESNMRSEPEIEGQDSNKAGSP